MPLVDQYRAMARYNSWMNERLYGVAAMLSNDERTRDLGAFFRSVHGTLNHLLLTDRAWMFRFTHDTERFASRDAGGQLIPPRGLDQELYADFDELRRQRAATDCHIEEWAAALDDDRLSAPLTYRTTAGVRHEHPLWWAATHFFNHQTHHRGQVTTLLKQLGRDPGVTDMIELLRTER